MDLEEERLNELMALKSIYENSFNILQSVGLQQFSVKLKANTTKNSEFSKSCSIIFDYTENYPNEGPKFRISSAKNLSDDDLALLDELIKSIIQSSIGYVMIFDILSQVQDKLNFICENEALMKKRLSDKNRREAERKEEAIFQGERVTVESFLKWRDGFIAEITAAKQKISENEETNKKLTGRELFLKDNRYDVSDLTFLETDGGEVVEVDESLFTDIDVLDLSDELEKEEEVV